MDYNNVATVIFSHPPIGAVGQTEQVATEKYGKDKVKVYKSEFINMMYGLVPVEGHHRPKSLFTIVCHIEDDGTERVVGVHGIGRGIDEIM